MTYTAWSAGLVLGSFLPTPLRCRAISRPARVFPMFASVHCFPIGETTRAPLFKHRDASGMSEVTHTSVVPMRSATERIRLWPPTVTAQPTDMHLCRYPSRLQRVGFDGFPKRRRDLSSRPCWNGVFGSMASIPSSSIVSATVSPWPAPRMTVKVDAGACRDESRIICRI